MSLSLSVFLGSPSVVVDVVTTGVCQDRVEMGVDEGEGLIDL